ncbi:outer membrane beta-barrel protein [Flavobacterium aquicola]|uniref:Outer membrane protein with beta-barrel domain n=1 Tax=Flavobacterium aquicola TaxID=1682742 RepID=A0A3E0E1V2_9FLAO|nr:outer membrane beta-barrel protein [Flavobacterium aquicola]REG92218.1 outer membrane protein with beta-barrel domain [Flavobacterium aquicola]
MKNYRLLLIALLFSAGMMAQDRGSVVGNIYGSYTFSNNVNFDYGHLDIGDGLTYGGGFEFFPQKSTSVELKYLRLDTSMDIDVPNGIAGYPDKKGDGAFNYILIGGNHYFDSGNNAVPYLGGGLGMAITEGPYGGSDTNFAWELKGGVKIKTASIVSISLQANLISTWAAAGTDTYWGYWGPVAVQDYAVSYQFGLGAVFGFNFH